MEKRSLPNATAVLVLGILSILTCCCYGIGLVLGIIALVLAHKDMQLYIQNPELYSGYPNLNTGKILSIIGIVLSGITIISSIYMKTHFTEKELQTFNKTMIEKLQKNQK